MESNEQVKLTYSTFNLYDLAFEKKRKLTSAEMDAISAWQKYLLEINTYAGQLVATKLLDPRLPFEQLKERAATKSNCNSDVFKEAMNKFSDEVLYDLSNTQILQLTNEQLIAVTYFVFDCSHF